MFKLISEIVLGTALAAVVGMIMIWCIGNDKKRLENKPKIETQSSPYQRINLPSGGYINVITVEGCEYFVGNTLGHKGNCKNLIHSCKCREKK